MSNYFGVYGMGVMGQSLAMNIAKNGFTTSVYNYEDDVTKKFMDTKAKGLPIAAYYTPKEFVDSLEKPRKILMMVTAGKVVDIVIESLLPYIEKGDVLIDAGNSYYEDTIRRHNALKEKGIEFFGAGVSGGERGALEGPSIMPSGNEETYRKYIEPVFNAIAAKTEDGFVCCKYLGTDGSGHYIKMVHNGIEYCNIELICETYDILKKVGHLTNEEIREVYLDWNKGRNESYLLDITTQVLNYVDERTGNKLVDMILDKAGQKGTGKWTCMDGLDIGCVIPSICESVTARNLSAIKEDRVNASKILVVNPNKEVNKEELINCLEKAFYSARLICYAQGFSQLREASKVHNWNLKYNDIAGLWQAGCIIRGEMLKMITNAFNKNNDLVNIVLVDEIAKTLVNDSDSYRKLIIMAIENGVPTPTMSSALNYFDGYRAEKLPANLLQGLRDFFGAHTYERIDDNGSGEHYHTKWEKF